MAFLSLLLYIACIYIRPADWIPAVYGWQILDYLAAIAFISWLTGFMIKKKVEHLKAPQNVLMLGLFLAFLLSHVAHTYFAGMMETFSEFSKIVIMYFLFVLIIDTEKKFKITVYLLIFLTLLLAIQGIQQFNTGFGWAGQPLTFQRHAEINSITGERILIPGRINWISIFNDPNDLGLAFVIAATLLFAFLFGKTNLFSKLITIPILGYILYAIYLTNSRGTLLALMTAGFFYFAKRSRRIILGVVIGILFMFLLFAFGPSRLTLLSTDESSAFSRVEMWYYAVQIIKSNPIFGMGYRMFEEQSALTTHNTFVLAFAEAGIIGLFFFVGLFYISFKGLSLVQRNNVRLRNYAYGIQASLIGFAVAAFFLSRLYIPLPYMLFALSASLFNIAKEKDTDLVNTLVLRDFRNIGFASIGIIVIFYALIKITL